MKETHRPPLGSVRVEHPFPDRAGPGHGTNLVQFHPCNHHEAKLLFHPWGGLCKGWERQCVHSASLWQLLGTTVEIKDCLQNSEEECVVLWRSPILQIQNFMEVHFPQACIISRDSLQSGHPALRAIALPTTVYIFLKSRDTVKREVGRTTCLSSNTYISGKT